MTLHVLDQVPDRLLDVIHLEGQRRPALEGLWSSVPTSVMLLRSPLHFCPGAPSASGGVRSTTTSIHFV
jgi:hypothetical protein